MPPEPHAAKAKQLLREYVDVRLQAMVPAGLGRALRRSAGLHEALWDQAEASAAAEPASLPVSLLVASLNEVIDLHQRRVTIALYLRLPPSILWLLYVVAVASLLVQGYSSGLTKTRARLPAVVVIVSVASVMLLIVDLDRLGRAYST